MLIVDTRCCDMGCDRPMTSLSPARCRANVGNMYMYEYMYMLCDMLLDTISCTMVQHTTNMRYQPFTLAGDLAWPTPWPSEL